MAAQDKRSNPRGPHWLSPYLLAVVLSPAVFQSSGSLTCKSGDTTLSELSVLVGSEDQLSFEPLQRTYDLLLAPGTDDAVVRAIPNDLRAQVWINLYSDSGDTSLLTGVVGGGEVTVALAPGLNTLRVYVKAPGGASDRYDLRLYVEAGLALAEWQPSEVLAEPTDTWGLVDAAGHLNGQAFVLWVEWMDPEWELVARRFSPDAGWDAPEPVHRDTTYPLEGEIAVGPGGEAVAVWRNDPSIWASIYTPGVGWSAAELIESEATRAFSPRAFVDAQGNVMVVWSSSDDRCWFNRYAPASGWRISAAAMNQASACSNPILAGNNAGEVIAVWDAYDAGSLSIWSQRYDSLAGWAAPELLSGPENDAYSPNAAMGPEGSAVVAWHQNETTADGEITSSVWGSRYAPASGWGAPQLVEHYDLDTVGDEDAPAVAVGPDGSAFVAWMQWEVSDLYSFFRRADVRANHYRPGIGWGSAEIVAAGSGFNSFSEPPAVQGVQLIVDGFGNAVALWGHYSSVGQGFFKHRVWFSYYRPAVGWSEPQVVSEPGDLESDQQFSPVLIPGASGEAKAFWEESRGSATSLRTSRFE
jgi:hypothetical protein